MIVNYTTIRSVNGLSQTDLRGPAVSGTYTETVRVSGVTNWNPGNQLFDGVANQFTADMVGDIAVNTTTGDRANITSFIGAPVLGLDAHIFPTIGHGYEVRAASGDLGLLLTTVAYDGKGFHYIFIDETPS